MTKTDTKKDLREDAMENMGYSEAYRVLYRQLDDVRSITDLFKIANSDEFKAGAAALGENKDNYGKLEIKALREFYKTRQDSLQGRILLNEIDGERVTVFDVEYWDSNFGSGVTLHYYLGEPGLEANKRQSQTSSAPIVRAFNDLREPIIASKPETWTMFLFTKKPHEYTDKETGEKKDGAIWSVRRLPKRSSATKTDGAPF